MKNILLVLVGGTICTEINDDGMLSCDKKAGIHLKENFLNSSSKFKDKAEITLTENLLILSENMTVEKWNVIINTLRKALKEKSYDGIILAHGTDTLAYSSALFSLVLCSLKIPVFFVSANETLLSERSNGNQNFRCAVECICRGIPANVYAVYKNISDGKMYLHLASRLLQCANYSEDFYSVGAMDISKINSQNYKLYFEEIEKNYPESAKKPFIELEGDWKLSECVLKIDPYVSINYDAFDYSKFSAVLHGSYHSGTACSEKNKYSNHYGKNSALYMIDKCALLNPKVDVYFSPAKISHETYETVGIIGEHTKNGQKAEFIYGVTNEMAYAKLLLLYSIYETKDEILKVLAQNCNFEKIV